MKKMILIGLIAVLMSFGIQAKSLEFLAKHKDSLEKRVYTVPREIDDEVARIKLTSGGVGIDTLSAEQRAYLGRVE